MTDLRLSSYDPNVIFQRMVELGNDWADKNGAADLLEDSAKSVLSELIIKAPGKSMTEKEHHARASDEYRDFLRAKCEARTAANKARVPYDGAKAKLEVMRTLEATRRDEARLSGMQR